MYLQKPTGNILNGELLVAFSLMSGSTKNVHYSASIQPCTGNPTPRNRSGKRYKCYKDQKIRKPSCYILMI